MGFISVKLSSLGDGGLERHEDAKHMRLISETSMHGFVKCAMVMSTKPHWRRIAERRGLKRPGRFHNALDVSKGAGVLDL